MKTNKIYLDAAAIMERLESKKIIRSNELQDLGLSRKALSLLEEDGRIERLTRGVYVLANEPSSWTYYWSLSTQCPDVVFCLYSALMIHGVTTQFAHAIWCDIPRGTRRPKLEDREVEYITSTPWIHETGVIKVKLDGVAVRVTSLEKTVVDCFKLRRVVGMEVALEALKETINGGLVQVEDLVNLAKKMKMYTIMKPYIEAIL
ncbi:MAG: AbiEi antitoxin N-terminal domain-containing protein [Hafnia sp.]